jgi:asparagine synthase (glutamine-hydrolysing)
MCGIAGIVSCDPVSDGNVAVRTMTDMLQRRGPDGHGLCSWNTAILGHRRLAIIDLSELGGQPMLSTDEATGVVFNGAIYNFRELRADLERCGYVFRSTTDTEVLVHGYREWGIEGLVDRLCGMFAFAVYDDRSDDLFLVRDRLGVKPLLFAIRGDELAFASTVQALRSAGYGDAIDAQAVADFLEWGFVPEERSIYAGIRKLPPATILHWRRGQCRQWRYWSPRQSFDDAIGFEEAVTETERRLLTAVDRRTFADVPIGALLSGGIDSALICWALRECGANVNAFTFSAPHHAEDEAGDACLTAKELSIPVHVLETGSSDDEWLELMQAFAEPFACGSALGMLRLSRTVRENAVVLLTGDGGDDAFLGYSQHRHLLAAERLAHWIPKPVARLGARSPEVASASGIVKRGRNFISYTTGGIGSFLRVRSSFRFFHSSGMLGPRLRDLLPSSQSLPVVPGAGRSVLRDYLEYDREHQFVSEYLTKVDGATMHHGLEARSPFLDHELWDFAASLPYAVRLHNGQPKAILRAIARRRISARLAAGRKRGFEVPIAAWLRDRWASRARRLLDGGALLSNGWLDTRNLWAEFTTGRVPGTIVWNAVVLAQWLESHESESLAGASVAHAMRPSLSA